MFLVRRSKKGGGVEGLAPRAWLDVISADHTGTIGFKGSHPIPAITRAQMNISSLMLPAGRAPPSIHQQALRKTTLMRLNLSLSHPPRKHPLWDINYIAMVENTGFLTRKLLNLENCYWLNCLHEEPLLTIHSQPALPALFVLSQSYLQAQDLRLFNSVAIHWYRPIAPWS